MNIFLWILQILLALHTAIGAIWKFSHTAEQTMPSLAALPQGVWITMAMLELIFSLFLVAPLAKKSLAVLAPIGALAIAAEMIIFCGLHLSSGDSNYSPMIYWLVVAAIGGVIAYGRMALKRS